MSDPKIGLALGGGSARGLAHIPLLQVFDDLGLKPAIIAGCSIGSLVGSAYACGIPAREIAEHARAVLSKRSAAVKFIFAQKEGSVLNLFDFKSLGSMQIDGRVLTKLVLPKGVCERIEQAEIPLRIVTTDFYEQKQVVFDQGDLVDAVAASIAIPGLISAPRIEDRLLIDGGMTNPVPFECAREDCDFVVAVDVTGRPVNRIGSNPGNRELMVGAFLAMFNTIAELQREKSPPEIYIRPPVEGFPAHDFFKVEEIMAAGSQVADQLKRSIEQQLSKIPA